MPRQYGMYSWRVQKKEARRAEVELDGAIEAIQLENDMLRKQHDFQLQDIDDEEKFRPVDRMNRSVEKALATLEKLTKLKNQANELASLGIDVDDLIVQQTNIIKDVLGEVNVYGVPA